MQMGKKKSKRARDEESDDAGWDSDGSLPDMSSSKKPKVTSDEELTSQHAVLESFGNTQQGGPTPPSLAGLSAQSAPAQERTREAGRRLFPHARATDGAPSRVAGWQVLLGFLGVEGAEHAGALAPLQAAINTDRTVMALYTERMQHFRIPPGRCALLCPRPM